tara:strand:+ start:2028 stop:2789 length:762 start_codon:yes stop_codon:yes gene_type:complete
LHKSKKLSKFSEISHGFFNKNGGVSQGIYKSLNCGIGSKDKKTNIKKNLKIVRSKFKIKSNRIFFVKQFHTNKFIFLSKNSTIKNQSIRADAIICEKRKIPIGILTADCVPVLIYDNSRKLIAAIHAGWRGAYKGIIRKVIQKMIEKKCTPENMTVAIGPCISKKNYEVKKEFKIRFLKKDKKNIHFFNIKNKKIYFDLANYVKKQVKLNKIKNIDQINIDTFNERNNFFSARRSLKHNNNDYGRNISIIMIN